MTMKTLNILAACAVLGITAIAADRASESVVVGTTKTITRLVSVTPTFSDDSNVALVGISETFKRFTQLPDGSQINKTTFTRQWTAEAIAALPNNWTNNLGNVVVGNAYKARLQALWTSFDLMPEITTVASIQPGITYVPQPPPETP